MARLSDTQNRNKDASILSMDLLIGLETSVRNLTCPIAQPGRLTVCVTSNCESNNGQERKELVLRYYVGRLDSDEFAANNDG